LFSEDEKKIADLAGDIDEAVEKSKEEAEAIDDESTKEAGNILNGVNWKVMLGLLLLFALLFFFLRRK